MANKLNRLLGQSGEGLTGGLLDSFGGISYNRYTLTVEGFRSAISVLHVEGNEQLNQSWHYTFTSTDKATAATKALTLICGGSYIKISSEGIELGTQDNVYLKCNVMQKMGPASIENNTDNFLKSDVEIALIRLINSEHIDFSG
jgi:hypothetical protein